MDEKRKVGTILKDKIFQDLIEPSYYSDIKETLSGRKCWRRAGHLFESLSKILLAVSSVCSFAAGVYDDKILSFIAGTISTVSLATFQFSLYSIKMHKKNSFELNQLLEKIDIEPVPVFATLQEVKPNTIEHYEIINSEMTMTSPSTPSLQKVEQIITYADKIKDLNETIDEPKSIDETNTTLEHDKTP